jgi:ABC-type multidrug transport system ATPase subunit
VEQELLTVIRLHHSSKEEQDTHLNHLLENFGLEHQRKSPPYQLSGGEQRKLILALALASSASFFLFDEPTANLDQISRKFFLSKMISLKKDNKGVVIVSHDLEFVFAVADRIMILDEGQIVFLGSTFDLVRQFQSQQKTFFHLPAIYSFLQTEAQRPDVIKKLETIITEKAFFTPLNIFEKIMETKNNGN